jgi:hypothetical protein
MSRLVVYTWLSSIILYISSVLQIIEGSRMQTARRDIRLLPARSNEIGGNSIYYCRVILVWLLAVRRMAVYVYGT